MQKKYYAVKKGKTPGIYFDWESCKTQVDGFPGAVYKSFRSVEEAEAFISSDVNHSKPSDKTAERPDVEKDTAVAYVDGSFSEASGKFSYGVVFFTENETFKFSKAFSDKDLVEMRNVAGEIAGAAYAMKYAMDLGLKKLTICHDYEGIAKWCLGEWKTNKDGTKKYKAYYDDISKNLSVEFIKVKAHSKDVYNDMADSLARSALED